MAGRDEAITRIVNALNAGPNSFDYAMVVTGIRGSGKTALVAHIAELMHSRGWGVLQVTASGDERLEAAIQVRSSELSARASRLPRLPRILRRSRFGFSRLRGVQAAGFGLEWDAATQPLLSQRLHHLARNAARRHRGLLLTVDEMHKASDTEIAHMAVCCQEILGVSGLPMAFLGAGLPELRSRIDSNDGMTFFHRCGRLRLGLLDDTASRSALLEPLQRLGRTIEEDALDAAVQRAMGYPFKLQLIGYHAWSTAGAEETITKGSVVGAAHTADQIMLSQVVLPIWTHLSDPEQRLLQAMSQDDEVSSSDDLSARTSIPALTVETHLQEMEIVGAIERLSVHECCFQHPLMKEWLRGTEFNAGAQTALNWHLPSPPPDTPNRVSPPRISAAQNKTKRSDLRAAILAAYSAHPYETNAQLARRVGASRSYVGKVLGPRKR